MITGASRRIGAGIARHLHQKNIDVVVHYRHSKAAAESLVKSLNLSRPASALAVHGNLLDKASYDDLIAHSLALNGVLDILINNASMFYPTPVTAFNEDDWDALIGTNLKAPLFLSRNAAPHLEQQRGCIINITDIHGLKPLAGHPLYSMAKAGLIMLTQSLARELAPAVRINAISPGAILWPETMKAEVQADILARIPLKRQGEPGDIAKAAYFLIAEADYITGQILSVDGGRSLYS